jgi:hypothetical protein
VHACDLTSMRYFKIENWIQVNNHLKCGQTFGMPAAKQIPIMLDFALPGYSQDIDWVGKERRSCREK